jgi:uncharacterized protein YbjT (DUF2867 family)
MSRVFVTGGTGYMGRALIAELLRRGHAVRALVRESSRYKLPAGCSAIIGDALQESSYQGLGPEDTVVHLVGVPHPSPAKADQFRTVDLASIRAAAASAGKADVRHFIYVSVAHPAPVMRAYIAARVEGEALLGRAGLHATILRPWYVLGPGHRWPVVLLPLYWLMERLPATRDSARRLGLVTLSQMVRALAAAVDQPASGTRVLDVPGIRMSK